MSNVEHPKHYNTPGRKECIVEMVEKYGFYATATFALLNSYKYLYREGEKEDNPSDQDINKAQWYMDWVDVKATELKAYDVFDWVLYWDVFTLLQEKKRLPWVIPGYLEDDCK